jgi:hypothetical protein
MFLRTEENPLSGIPKEFCGDAALELFKTYITSGVMGKPVRINP